MRVDILHNDGGGDRGYPVFGCNRCRAIYHLPQGVRWNELALLSCVAEARTKGWTVPQDGQIYCPRCSPNEATGPTT